MQKKGLLLGNKYLMATRNHKKLNPQAYANHPRSPLSKALRMSY